MTVVMTARIGDSGDDSGGRFMLMLTDCLWQISVPREVAIVVGVVVEEEEGGGGDSTTDDVELSRQHRLSSHRCHRGGDGGDFEVKNCPNIRNIQNSGIIFSP